MAEHTDSDPRTVNAGVKSSWTTARLVEPTSAGFLYLGVSSGRWLVPFALPRPRRRRILALMEETAGTLRRDPRVARADVFAAVLRPPGGNAGRGGDVPEADFDAVLLIETSAVADAAAVAAEGALADLVGTLEQLAPRTLVFAGSNVRRIGPVDHDRQGVFLFNYFSAGDVDTNLDAWQYTAGWFQDETGLDNSTVLQPADPATPYTLVNHCRWDRLRDILPALVFKRSFRTFVLRVFARNGVVPRPILYKLHRGRA